MNKQKVTFQEALAHGTTRKLDEVKDEWVDTFDDITWFTDGTAVAMEHIEGVQYSEHTWDPCETQFTILTP